VDINSPEIQKLKAKVRAADEEFAFAQACHEAWKPTAYDAELHQRLGSSYATNTFNLIRLVLRREMVLGLMRLWDKDKRTVDMRSIANALADKRIVDALAADYAAHWQGVNPSDLQGVPEQYRAALADSHSKSEMKFGQQQSDKLREKASEAICIIRKYQEGGSDCGTAKKLKKLRDDTWLIGMWQ
jgi:hypothetical protein